MANARQILVIDDNSVDLEIIAIVCGALGCEVDVALDGFEAINLYLQKRHALVITDYCMEPMNGIYLISKIKEIDPDAAFLMISGCPDTAARAFILEHDLPKIVIKPIDLQQMVDTLKWTLAQGSEYGGRRHVAVLADHMDACPMLIGDSELMQAVRASLLQAVADQVCVFVLYGEDGVGRGEVARLLHQCGAHSRRHLVEHDFAKPQIGNPLDLILTEDLKPGPLLERARHGTLVLQGIEALSPADRARLDCSLKTIAQHSRLVLVLDEQMLQPAPAGMTVAAIRLPRLGEHAQDLPTIIRLIAESPVQFALERVLSDQEIQQLAAQLSDYYFPGNITELVQRIRCLSENPHRG